MKDKLIVIATKYRYDRNIIFGNMADAIKKDPFFSCFDLRVSKNNIVHMCPSIWLPGIKIKFLPAESNYIRGLWVDYYWVLDDFEMEEYLRHHCHWRKICSSYKWLDVVNSTIEIIKMEIGKEGNRK